MAVPIDANAPVGVDCLTALPGQTFLLQGWLLRQPGPPGILSVQSDGADCPISHAGFTEGSPGRHPGPHDDVALLFSLPEGGPTPPDHEAPTDLALTLQRGDARWVVPVAPAALGPDAAQATPGHSGPGWSNESCFALLRDCAGSPDLAALLHHGGTPFGILGDWLGRLNPVRGRSVENAGALEEAETLTSPAGEVMVVVRGGTPFDRSAGLEVAAVGLAPAAAPGRPDAGPGPLVAEAVPLLDWHSATLPQALVGHGRIDPAWLDRLSLFDLVLRVQPRAGETQFLRCRPRMTTIPDLLDSVCRTTPFAEPTEATGAEALALLRVLIARREAVFLPVLAALAGQSAGPEAPDHLPRQVLILGADDPLSARLFQVTAAEFEGRADAVLLLGDAADAVAEVFLRRGKVAVKARGEALAALRHAAGRAGIIAVEAVRFAEAVGRNRPAEAFARPLGAAELIRLLALHRFAGCEAAMSDSIGRLLRRSRPGEAAFMPIRRGWSGPLAAALVTDHLARLWLAGDHPAVPGPGDRTMDRRPRNRTNA